MQLTCTDRKSRTTDHFRRVRKISKGTTNFFMSVPLSTWETSAPTGRIFVKVDI